MRQNQAFSSYLQHHRIWPVWPAPTPSPAPADALDLSALPRAASAVQFVTGEPAAADQQIVGEDLRKLARQAMNDLIASGRHGQN